MKLTIKYFAALRENAGKSEEERETSAATAEELHTELNNLYNFTVKKKHLCVAINEEYCDFNTQLNEGDTVVFIPPVAGG